jgi:hypothetical protein
MVITRMCTLVRISFGPSFLECTWWAGETSSMSAHVHAWEQPVGNTHQWDRPDGDFWDCREDCDSDWEEEQSNAGLDFVRFVLSLATAGHLSCTQCCILMYLAYHAGIEQAKRYMLQPGAATGHYGRKLRRAMGHTAANSDLYGLEVPGTLKRDLARVVHNFWTIPGHEQLADDVGADPVCRARLKEHIRNGDLPPAYWEHPVVAASSEEDVVYPYALYMDGVPYSNTDGVLGVWLVNLVSSVRYLTLVLRKKSICQCGCRGWCSYFSVFLYLAWQIAALAEGRRPSKRHDGSDWKPSDKKRASLAGEIMTKGACIYIKGDWCEYAQTFAFPAWNDTLRPCFECVAFGIDMYCSAGNSIHGLRWRPNEDGDYEQACARCEIHVALTTESEKLPILQRLRYDKSDAGSHGRVLSQSLPTLNLEVGDRLEPSCTLPDVGDLENLALPAVIIFWRKSLDTLTRHRNPLFNDATGLSPKRSMTIDTLHALYLGVLNTWAKTATWFLLVSGLFGNLHYADENLRAAVMVLRNSLVAWYKQRRADHPHESLTEISDLTVKMVGSRNEPKLKTKGAETWAFSLFLIDQLRKLGPLAGPDHLRLLHAGECLQRMVQIWGAHGWTIPEAAQEQLMESYNAHIALMAPFGVYTPKHHIIYHLLEKIGYQGNPREYACWLDESLNRQLKGACRNVSQATFEHSVLLAMRDLMRPDASHKRW